MSKARGIHAVYGRIFKIWRKKRFEIFVNEIQPTITDTCIDVGGYPAFWAEKPNLMGHIDTLNVHPVTWSSEQSAKYNISCIVGDGCDMPFADKAYDIGFSNSVIEHVSTWENQQRFASEIRRVADALWVQTPAYECPIEPHYLAPFIHYLPPSWRVKLIRWFTPRGWIERPKPEWVREMVATTRLLRRSEFESLFPDCEILTEKMLGCITKSYIAVRKRTK